MKSAMTVATVQGIKFSVYSDFIARATFATNENTGECKRIKANGYMRNELSIRKAIALVFGFESFKK